MHAADVLRIAAACSVDPRTVQRYLDGDSVRPLTANAIEDAARKLGITLQRATVVRGEVAGAGGTKRDA